MASQFPEESIYNLIPQPEAQGTRPSMYRSRYPANCPPTASTFGRATAAQTRTTNLAGDYELAENTHRHRLSASTFGARSAHYSDPTVFLKKNSQPDLPEVGLGPSTDLDQIMHKETRGVARAFTYPDDQERKPAVVRREEAPSRRRANNQNFVAQNAIAAITARPKRRGEGQVNYLKKPDFGKVPAYLDEVKKEQEAERDYVRQLVAQEEAAKRRTQPNMRLLPEEEREELLASLKQKWEAVNRQYQGMTHIVSLDTIGKTRRKEEYEQQLQQLERSIEKLSKKYVFVHDEGV